MDEKMDDSAFDLAAASKSTEIREKLLADPVPTGLTASGDADFTDAFDMMARAEDGESVR
jgi:hypothetical protein